VSNLNECVNLLDPTQEAFHMPWIRTNKTKGDKFLCGHPPVTTLLASLMIHKAGCPRTPATHQKILVLCAVPKPPIHAGNMHFIRETSLRRHSYLDPNIHGTLKPRRGTTRHRPPTFTSVQRRLTVIADKYSLDMQNVRFQLILELKALAELAQQKAIDTHPAKDDTKQNWIRLTAYIGQVINAVGKTYEEIKTDEDLKTLENLITEFKQKQTPQQEQQQ
jgi:hypothetical protein